MSCCQAIPGTTSVFVLPGIGGNGVCSPINRQQARCLGAPVNPLTPYDVDNPPARTFPNQVWNPNSPPPSLLPNPPQWAINLYLSVVATQLP